MSRSVTLGGGGGSEQIFFFESVTSPKNINGHGNPNDARMTWSSSEKICKNIQKQIRQNRFPKWHRLIFTCVKILRFVGGGGTGTAFLGSLPMKRRGNRGAYTLCAG